MLCERKYIILYENGYSKIMDELFRLLRFTSTIVQAMAGIYVKGYKKCIHHFITLIIRAKYVHNSFLYCFWQIYCSHAAFPYYIFPTIQFVSKLFVSSLIIFSKKSSPFSHSYNFRQSAHISTWQIHCSAIVWSMMLDIQHSVKGLINQIISYWRVVGHFLSSLSCSMLRNIQAKLHQKIINNVVLNRSNGSIYLFLYDCSYLMVRFSFRSCTCNN